MKEDEIKEVLYGAITGLMSNRNYFHKSSVTQYSKWTDEGEKAVLNLLKTFAVPIVVAQEQTLKEKSKELLMNTLKKD